MPTPRILPLPLHPRRAQQLFQDVLLTDNELTPQISNKSLQRRLLELQRLNLSGIQEAKRGTRFQRIRAGADLSPHVETEETTLRLVKDGSELVMATDTRVETSSVRLLDINGIVLYTTPLHSFSLQIDSHNDGGSNNDATAESDDIFVAPSADTLTRWIVALTCGVNAFQQQESSQRDFPDAKQADLVWQALRLRIFELADIVAISTAVEHVTRSIPDHEYQQSEALRRRVQFLRCDVAAQSS